jgi:hypothetical protein
VEQARLIAEREKKPSSGRQVGKCTHAMCWLFIFLQDALLKQISRDRDRALYA